jgi:hypothetical protein
MTGFMCHHPIWPKANVMTLQPSIWPTPVTEAQSPISKPPRAAPVKFAEQVKRERSQFVRTLPPRSQRLFWQLGHGMLSISRTDRNETERYVCNLEECQRQRTSHVEYRTICSAGWD